MTWINVKEQLPKDRQRCLIYDRSCHCSLDGTPETITHIYTARFYQGEHRPNGPWRGCDTGFDGNNHFPWCWEEGARRWFSQDVTFWAELPDLPMESSTDEKL